MTVARRSTSPGAQIVPLGDQALLVRFGSSLDERANSAALTLSQHLIDDPIAGVVEVVPSLVSVLLRYDPDAVKPERLAGEVGLRLTAALPPRAVATHNILVNFDGPDLAEVASRLGLDATAFISRHNARPLRVLTTGFAPGFVYCGFHEDGLVLPRRREVRTAVAAGSVLFAAGQTAIAATEIPTGWHVIGHTRFRNFTPEADRPTQLRAGDLIQFGAML